MGMGLRLALRSVLRPSLVTSTRHSPCTKRTAAVNLMRGYHTIVLFRFQTKCFFSRFIMTACRDVLRGGENANTEVSPIRLRTMSGLKLSPFFMDHSTTRPSVLMETRVSPRSAPLFTHFTWGEGGGNIFSRQ